jgi:hypothetical protein
MKLKLIALTIACTTILTALPVAASANSRQAEYDFNVSFGMNGDWIRYGDDWQFLNPNDICTTGSAINITTDQAVNITTCSAVLFSFDVTTAPAVNFIPFDVTTAPAVSVPIDIITTPNVPALLNDNSNFENVINECNREEDKLDNFVNKINDKINDQFNKAEKRLDRVLNFIRR